MPMRKRYDFGAMKVGDTKLFEWHEKVNKNYLIRAALLNYTHRSGRKFEYKGKPLGLEVTRIL